MVLSNYRTKDTQEEGGERAMTQQQSVKCPICGGQFQSQQQLEQHAKEEHQKK